MRAVVQDRYGSADVLRVDTIAVPGIGNDQVLVRVAAAGVDRGTWHLMTGRPSWCAWRSACAGHATGCSARDLAGTVVAVGAAVTRFAVGDAVFGVGSGTFAEYAAAKETKLAPRRERSRPSRQRWCRSPA